MSYSKVSLFSLLAKSRILSFTRNIWRKMSFQVKFQFKIRQKCRSKWNDIGHTLELGRYAPVKQTQTEKFSRYILIFYFSPIQIQYWWNCRKVCQTVSDRPKIMVKFSQLAYKNGYVLLPGVHCGTVVARWMIWQIRVFISLQTRVRFLILLYIIILIFSFQSPYQSQTGCSIMPRVSSWVVREAIATRYLTWVLWTVWSQRVWRFSF